MTKEESASAKASADEGKNHVRPSWDEYFMNMVKVIGSRGTCDRGRSGCVITRDNYILMTGYVGSPKKLSHCDDAGHEMHTVTHEDGKQTQHCIRTAHAEQNAIANAARLGIALEGATLYCQMTPCYVCAKMIINAGIVKVVCIKDYHAGDRSKEIFKEAKVDYILVNEEVQQYENM